MSVEAILKEREKTHGDFMRFSHIAQGLKGHLSYAKDLSKPQREALEMILHKVARVLNGDEDHRDHWDDIAGYATLIARTL